MKIRVLPAVIVAALLCASAGAIARTKESTTDTGPEPYFCSASDLDGPLPRFRNTERFATFNVSLNRNSEGQLIADLTSADDQLGEGGSDTQARAIAEIIQRVRPDVVLLNEFDYDAAGVGIELFQQNFLGQSQNGQKPIRYPHVFNAPSNTGVPSGVDLDNSGGVGGPNDAQGFGFFPGQFGMVLLSRYPIMNHKVRTFQNFLWKDMPASLIPTDYYSDEAQAVLRLSSKSHWDVPISIDGSIVHLLAAHPTPPVFDGPEDRNGRRNHDEIRFWIDYVSGRRKDSRYIYDDDGQEGGLDRGEAFVIVGDYNADPFDGDSTDGAANQFFSSPRIDGRLAPGSSGAVEDSLLAGQANAGQQGDPALDTADFNPAAPGNLRVDYVLPSKAGLTPKCGGVFWPTVDDETRYLVGDGFPVISSDHHLVWLDIRVRD